MLKTADFGNESKILSDIEPQLSEIINRWYLSNELGLIKSFWNFTELGPNKGLKSIYGRTFFDHDSVIILLILMKFGVDFLEYHFLSISRQKLWLPCLAADFDFMGLYCGSRRVPSVYFRYLNRPQRDGEFQ